MVGRLSWGGLFLVGVAFYGAIMALLYLADLARGKTRRGEAKDSGTVAGGLFVIQFMLALPFAVLLRDTLPGKPGRLQHGVLFFLAFIGYLFLGNRLITWLVPEKPTGGQ